MTANINVSPIKPSSHHDTTPPAAFRDLLMPADVLFNGDRPWDITVHNRDTYRYTFAKGTLGFGEAYMNGYWDCEQLDECFTKLLRVDIDQKLRILFKARLLLSSLSNLVIHTTLNLQTKDRAYQVGEQHYDIGNDIYSKMLDPLMNYSCGFWHNTDSLDQAQINKLDLVCKKMELKPGDKLLDIGCGWGALSKYASEHYGVSVTGITISKEQQKMAQDNCRHLDVNILLTDYRTLKGEYNKIASIGMFEHVGSKNYKTYFNMVRKLLADDGLMLLHTIGDYSTHNTTDAFIHKYIFPNAQLPSASRITKAIEPDLVIRDWHDFGPDYDKTLMAWWANFEKAWPQLSEKYSQRFYRMWKYYIHISAGMFRSGQGQLWQIVLSKRGARPDYHSYRP